MIAGLPVATWLLMLAATAPGLAVAFVAYRIHGGAGGRRGSG